jgi:hypothetical protein
MTERAEMVMSTKRDWTLLLAEFTRRNAARPTRLELNDPELGAQVLEEDVPLHGITYDPRDDRIEIMLGEAGASRRHLTHAIAQRSGIELLRTDGVDHALCIEHEGMRTLLFIRHSPANLHSSSRTDEHRGHV